QPQSAQGGGLVRGTRDPGQRHSDHALCHRHEGELVMATELRPDDSKDPLFAEPKPAADFTTELAGLNAPKAAGDAAGAMAYLGKCMPGAKIDGMQLPAIDNLDPTKKKQYEEIIRNKEFRQTKEVLAQRLKVWGSVLGSAEDFDAIVESTQQRLERLEAL